jgi:hypothetical protein
LHVQREIRYKKKNCSRNEDGEMPSIGKSPDERTVSLVCLEIERRIGVDNPRDRMHYVWNSQIEKKKERWSNIEKK